MAHLSVFEKFQDSQPRACGLQAAGLQVVDVGHVGSPRGRRPFPLSYSVLLPRKQDRAANADFGVTVSHCGVRACAEPHTLPDGNPAGELHHPGNGRAAQARTDPRSGAICAGHAPGQRHLSRGTLGLRLSASACQQPRDRVPPHCGVFRRREDEARGGRYRGRRVPGKARTVKLVIAGAGGRMGRTLIEMALASGELKLAAALEVPGSPVIGKDAGELIGRPCGVKLASLFEAAVAKGDCLIDFTRPEGTLTHLEQCLKKGLRMVIGTTGFSAEQDERIAAAAGKIAIVKAPNMSPGVNVAFRLVETAALALGAAYDVEILEAHHRHKIDAPSGTALKFGEVIARALGRDLARTAVYERKGEVGERDSKAIGFHSVRGGDIVGEHTVMFIGEGERVEITVRSGSGATSASGPLRAARFLKDKNRGLYDMQDVLGLR